MAPREALAWLLAWGAVLALAWWLSRLSAPALGLAGAGTLLWVALRRRRSLALLLSAAALALACGVAAGIQLRLATVAGDWERLEGEIEERAATALNRELDALVERGEVAVAGVESALRERIPVAPDAALFARLERLRANSGVEALALYDPNGVALAWAGEHRGTVPPQVRRGEQAYTYHEGPLFGYLYFVRPLPGGRTAMAAMLLSAQVRMEEGTVPFAERFARRFGFSPRFTQPERARGPAIWDWSTDRPILSVSFATLTQQHWWERVAERGRRTVAVLWVLALLGVSLLWYRTGPGMPGVPVAVATASFLLLPLRELLGAGNLFSPLLFVLPGPGDVTLGMLLVLLIGGSVWLLTRIPGGRGGVPLPLLALGAALVVPAALLLVQRSAAAGLLAGSPAGGIPLKVATTLLIALPLAVLLALAAPPPGRRRLWVTLLGMGLALLLGGAVAVSWRPHEPVPLWAGALWSLPFALLALGAAPADSRRRALRDWSLAAWLGASAALPHLYLLHLEADIAGAEGELTRLGTETDPFLNFLLRQFAERALSYHGEGDWGVNLLYHSWVASGLAREGYEARLTLWREGEPETELRLSEVAAEPEAFAREIPAAAAAAEPVIERYTDTEGLHYLLLVPLGDGSVVSVAVPPRYRLGRATALARYLQPAGEMPRSAAHEMLYLVPISPEEREEVEAGALDLRGIGVEWERTPAGWRSEARAHFPSGWVHAHLLVRTTPLPLLGVRALLLLLGLVGLAVLLWGAGRLLCGELPVVEPLRRQWLRSFRGRLTLALFTFFLLPMAVWGAVAYGAVAREVVRSAGALAQRALEQAVREVPRAPLGEVGAQVGTDLLLFRNGALMGAAATEVLDLGLFHTWLPPEIFLGFARGEDLEAREERRLAGNDYLIAYRRLDPAVVLAAPIPLASDEITRRQRDFAHVALLMSLLGAAFSVFLSLLVGRALTRPLDQLGRAVATVGTGNLRVRLPQDRPDEFGSVYAAFNRMVRRIRRARAALVRETRRTETIVAEAATGVLALDDAGRVELANPRAAEILESPLESGRPLPRTGPLLTALAEVVERFWSERAPEAAHELEVDGRIVRLRLRRLRGPQEQRGAVLALEDVTSEIRTARVLAWGEMARQVAHEIKNPLTPIKLAVQHLKRARADRRPDFDEILDRNVEAILTEIDRLGEISRAFARFGTPQQRVEEPEGVDLRRVVEETLVLYRGAADGLSYRVEFDAGVPPRVVARTGELKEVLVNLLENAREALDGEGEVRVAAAPAGEERVELVVEDTGEGIPAEQLGRIFDPHFSTRSSGTGLGLAIVRRLVESWGGTVEVESQPGAGTRIRILLRVAEGGEGFTRSG